MQSVFPKNRDKLAIFKASTLTAASLAIVFFTPGSAPEAMPEQHRYRIKSGDAMMHAQHRV